jgi:zinc protease
MAIHSSGSFEGHGVSIDALAVDASLALEWLAELVLTPSFPEERCTWLRRQGAAELESLRDQPEVRTSWAFQRQLYIPHPRSRPVQGTAEGLAAFGAAECGEFHRRALQRGVLLTLAGDLSGGAQGPAGPDLRDLAARAEELFAGLARGGDPDEEPAPAQGLPELRQEVPVPGDQAHLFAGHLTVPRNHPDATALEVLAVILGAGSGLSGRLPTRIREREGLAYSTQVHTLSGAGVDPGRLVVYVGTSAATVEQAETGVREELERLLSDGVGEEEVAEAKSYLLGREAFRRETARQWAELMLDAELYALPLDHPRWRLEQFEAVDRSSVEAAAERHLRPRELRVTVGLPTGS